MAFLVTACVLFIIASFSVKDSGGFLNANAFGTLIYWLLTIVGAVWYLYRFGFPKAMDNNGQGEKTFQVLLSIFVPLLVGMGIALAIYYLLFGLAILLLASLGYIVTVALVVGLFFGIRFLINIYFNPTGTEQQQSWLIILSVVVSIVLLFASLWANSVF